MVLGKLHHVHEFSARFFANSRGGVVVGPASDPNGIETVLQGQREKELAASGREATVALCLVDAVSDVAAISNEAGHITDPKVDMADRLRDPV